MASLLIIACLSSASGHNVDSVNSYGDSVTAVPELYRITVKRNIKLDCHRPWSTLDSLVKLHGWSNACAVFSLVTPFDKRANLVRKPAPH